MSNQTVFYILGISLVVSALIVSAVGLRMPTFPPNRGVLTGVVVFFVALVAATATFAVMNAQDEQAKTEAEAAAEFNSTGTTSTAPASSTSSTTATTATTGGSSSATSTTSSSTSTSAGGPGGTVAISADPTGQLAFQQKSVTTQAGPVTIDFTNQSPVGHDVKVEDSTGKQFGGTDLVTGGKGTATVQLAPGNYTFYCDVPGHQEAGMEGRLTVK